MKDRLVEFYQNHPEALGNFKFYPIDEYTLTLPELPILAVCKSCLTLDWNLVSVKAQCLPNTTRDTRYGFTFNSINYTGCEDPSLKDFFNCLMPICQLSPIVQKGINLWEAPFPINESLNRLLAPIRFQARESAFHFGEGKDLASFWTDDKGKLVFETIISRLQR